MKTRPYTLHSACFMVLLLLGAPCLGSPTAPPDAPPRIRGRVVTYNLHTGNYTGVPKARIDLLSYDSNTQKWRRVKTVHTNAGGYYFFLNLSPKTYKIRVNNKRNYRVTVVEASGAQFQDIPPIRLS